MSSTVHRLTISKGRGTKMYGALCSCKKWSRHGFDNPGEAHAAWLERHAIPPNHTRSSRFRKHGW